MNRNAYLLGIFFLLMTLVSGLMHALILLKQGFSMIYLQSYASWYLVFGLVYFAAVAFVLYYFHVRQLRFVFIAALVTALVSVAQFILQYFVLLTVARELSVFVSLLSMVSLLGNAVVGAGFIFSPARRDKVLMALGIILLIHSVSLLVVASGMSSGIPTDQQMNTMIRLTVIANIFPLFYIVVFFREMINAKSSTRITTAQETFYYIMGGVGMIGAMALLTLGGKLSTESYWYRDWETRAPEEARKLAERFETRIFAGSEGDTLQYLLLKPLDYDSTQKYPIVTCLHGGPTRGMHIEVTEPAPTLSEPGNRKKYPAFLFVPQAGAGVLWGGLGNIPSREKIVFETLNALEQEFSIDEKRRYVAGISGGGYGSWHFISTHPDMFAAAMPICGAGNPDYAEKITNIPVWAFHGDVDRNVNVSGSRNMIEAMRKAGGNPKYSEFAGVGHNVWPEVSKTEGVLEWLFSQKRE